MKTYTREENSVHQRSPFARAILIAKVPVYLPANYRCTDLREKSAKLVPPIGFEYSKSEGKVDSIVGS